VTFGEKSRHPKPKLQINYDHNGIYYKFLSTIILRLAQLQETLRSISAV
jgi:hypothetical protein